MGSFCSIQFYCAVDLFDEIFHQLKAQSFCFGEIQVLRQSDPIVLDCQMIFAGLIMFHPDHNVAFPSLRKCILQRIGNEFMDDQTAGNSMMNIQEDILDVSFQLNIRDSRMVLGKEYRGQPFGKVGEIYV